jgi:DNA-binding PadR family transcriptional regulator
MMSGHQRGGFARWPAPPWAAGWGPPWARGEGGPERPRAPKGNVRTAILALLAEGPRHGYQLMQDIAERSHDVWRPSPGSVYPVLSALQDEGLVDDEKVEGRRVFTLTEAGRAHVTDRTDELGAVFDAFSPEAEQPEEADMRHLVASVAGAAVQVLTTGTPEQRDEAQRILSRTRRELYGVLAEEATDQ